jgi:hypothetical protein
LFNYFNFSWLIIQEFVHYARHTLHEFLSFDNNRFSFVKSNGTADGKRKEQLKKGFQDGESQSNGFFTSATPPQINLKTIGIEKAKRKLLKLLLKIKEEERLENGDLPPLNLLKDCQLLARYVKEEKLPHLVLKLFPADQGYALSLRRAPDRPSVKSMTNGRLLSPSLPETIRLPYDQSELLAYIDNEQLPPMLLDVLDSNSDSDQFLDFFHQGRLFVEVQDFRRNAYASARKHEPRFVALKPTTQSLLSDLERLAASSVGSKSIWNEQEKLELESRLVLSTAEPMCLDPNPMVFLSTNEMQFERKWFKTAPVQRYCIDFFS